MNIVPLTEEMVVSIELQDSQLLDDGCLSRDYEYAKMAVKAGPAVAGICGNEVMFCFGRATIWNGRHMLWAMLSRNAGKHMLAITKAMKRMMSTQAGLGRFEFYVREDFEQGRRWADMFGFKLSSIEEHFLPDGSNACIYVKVM